MSPYVQNQVSAHKKRQVSIKKKFGLENVQPVLDGKSEYVETGARSRIRFALPEIYQLQQMGKKMLKNASSRSVKEVESTAVSAYVIAAR